MREEWERYPCVGCGYCCIRRTCAYGISLHPQGGEQACPELRWTGRRYVCRLMERQDGMGAFYRDLLKAGQGCRSHANPWRQDVRCRDGEKAPEDY
ncbi:MAG: hypothetical protein N2Z74_07875 [Syntrophales bacterium]|nr:hypothetical protein [Syntrophales bacterium]